MSDRYCSYDTAVGWHNQNLGASKGRLTFAQEGSTASEMFVYDPMGRVTRELECLPTECGIGADDKWLDYSYDLAGNMTSATDAAGDTYTYTYSPAGEVTSINQSPSSATQPAALVSNVQNGPDGPVSYQLGDGDGVYRIYDTMERPQGQWVCPGAPNQGCGSAANVIQSYQLTWLGSHVTSSDEIEAGSEQVYGYGYDEFGRLASVVEPSSVQQLYSWVYDRYGNRWQQNALSGGSQSSLRFNEVTNQINTAGFAYDAAGNLAQDPEHHYSYDAEGNLVEVDGGATATYTYGPLNHRVEIAEPNGEIGLLYNLAGQQASNWLLQSQNAPVGFGMVSWDAMRFGTGGGLSILMNLNWEGSVRATTDSGSTGAGGMTNLPFGDGTNLPSVTDETLWFAGMQMDAYSSGPDSGTDHATFREYGNAEGRWMSPDPYAGSYNFADPQSLNRYSYVLNNPLGLTDPEGLDGDGIFSGGGAIGGCIGAVATEGGNIYADLGCGFSILEGLIGLFDKPAFHGSLRPRPSTGSPAWISNSGETLGLPAGMPLNNIGLLQALGLPAESCDFAPYGLGPSDFGSGSDQGLPAYLTYQPLPSLFPPHGSSASGAAIQAEQGTGSPASYTAFLACEVDHGIGDADQDPQAEVFRSELRTFSVVNSAPFVFASRGLPARTVIAAGVAVVYDLSYAIRIREACVRQTYGPGYF